MRTLPVISLWQPFASLLFEFDKDRGAMVKAHETRGWRLPERLIGQEVAIHATKTFPAWRLISKELHELCLDRWGCQYHECLPYGAVIGIVRFAAPVETAEIARHVHPDDLIAGDWTAGRWAWPITEARTLKLPIPHKGKQGWGTVEIGTPD